MPDLPMFSIFDVTSKMQKELEFNTTTGTTDPLVGTGASLQANISVQQVTQNPDGTWREVISDEEFPVKDQNEITGRTSQERNATISNYEQIAAVYDNDILNYNNQINDKKQQIISLVNTAIGAGCSHIPIALAVNRNGFYVLQSSPPQPPLTINGVSCGIGSEILADQAILKIYSNLNNYSAENPFSPINQENLSSSNLGKGFENIVSNNSGSSYGVYQTIPTDPSAHTGSIFDPLTPAEQTACVGYGNSILTLAAEIGVLRGQRDQHLSELNNIKDLKKKAELRRWGNNQSDNSLENYNNSLRSAISSLSTFIDNIVIQGLIVHYNATENYGIETFLEPETGINVVSSWSNLCSDGLYAEPQTSTYNYMNFDNGDGPSVELNNYSTPSDQYFTIQNSYIGSGKIETGSSSYSIEAWVKITKDESLGASPTTNGASIVGINSTYGYGLQVYKPSGIRVSFGERGNGSLTNSSNLSTDTWYHIVATNEAGVGSKIYINGELDASGSAINITSSLSNLQIGYAPLQISQYFSGKVSIIRIYNRNLNQEEVNQNFNANKVGFGYT